MQEIKYKYCLDDKGTVVSIDELNLSNRKNSIYRCISCGEIMIPKIGTVRVPHFSHKPNAKCCNESYLHKLAKRLLVQKFNNSTEFKIKFYRTKMCAYSSICKYERYNCDQRYLEEFDLKEYYDTCREEVSISNFRSDILISDSTGRYKDPILIEIYCSHKSSQKKLESGMRIIEVKVASEEDVFRLFKEDLKESPTVTFIGFSKKSLEGHTNQCVELCRFVLYKSGRVEIMNHIGCHNRNIKNDNESRLELNIVPNCDYDKWKTVLYCGMVKCLDMGYKFKNCLLCKHHKLFDTDQLILCELNLIHKTPRNPEQTHCNNCPHYEKNYYDIRMIRASMQFCSIGIVGED